MKLQGYYEQKSFLIESQDTISDLHDDLGD